MQDNSQLTTQKIKAKDEWIKEMLSHYNGYLTYNTSPYIIGRVKLSDATITFYKTNVVLFQGLAATREYNYWATKYNLDTISDSYTSTIEFSNLSVVGSDEVGTGDYFGPIVVCATFVSNDQIAKLKELGVKDSKLLTDNQMIPMAVEISKIVKYSIVFLEPKKYNSLSPANSNLNYIKSYLHNKAITSILKKIENVKFDAILIDEFTPKEKYFEYLKNQSEVEKNITMVVRGENVHVAIAAASILARVTFLKELKKLSQTYEIDLYKGAGPEVDKNAISFVKANGWDSLKYVAKMKYANTERVKNYFLENPLPKSKMGSLIEQ